ncbi:hypothetical protein EYF80_042728 [Liparis tanakae]|uniref:Uncharacterized protein n=1 Tax=Liparis tanakae TaxID=230148 RepID=A0A4Z2G2H6_9TELE|nr:hypothetical protein EYF80_042728 [Liparis tanakae]
MSSEGVDSWDATCSRSRGSRLTCVCSLKARYGCCGGSRTSSSHAAWRDSAASLGSGMAVTPGTAPPPGSPWYRQEGTEGAWPPARCTPFTLRNMQLLGAGGSAARRTGSCTAEVSGVLNMSPPLTTAQLAEEEPGTPRPNASARPPAGSEPHGFSCKPNPGFSGRPALGALACRALCVGWAAGSGEKPRLLSLAESGAVLRRFCVAGLKVTGAPGAPGWSAPQGGGSMWVSLMGPRGSTGQTKLCPGCWFWSSGAERQSGRCGPASRCSCSSTYARTSAPRRSSRWSLLWQKLLLIFSSVLSQLRSSSGSMSRAPRSLSPRICCRVSIMSWTAASAFAAPPAAALGAASSQASSGTLSVAWLCLKAASWMLLKALFLLWSQYSERSWLSMQPIMDSRLTVRSSNFLCLGAEQGSGASTRLPGGVVEGQLQPAEAELVLPFFISGHNKQESVPVNPQRQRPRPQPRPLWAVTHINALCRTTMKSGLPALKTSRAFAWTQIHAPVLDRSLKTVKPLSPVFITGRQSRSTSDLRRSPLAVRSGRSFQPLERASGRGGGDSLLRWLSAQYIMSAAWMKL